MNDSHDLQRFLDGQARNYDAALAELTAGHKRSHWMWYVFPQIAGLGHSSTAQFYAIRDLDEAKGYLQHPKLGPRLKACCDALLQLEGLNAHQILGSPDDLKLRSSMTLFAEAAPAEARFQQVLEKFYDGQKDSRTLRILGRLD